MSRLQAQPTHAEAEETQASKQFLKEISVDSFPRIVANVHVGNQTEKGEVEAMEKDTQVDVDL